MILVFALTIIIGSATIAAVVAGRSFWNKQWRGELVAYRLRFPRELTAAAVVAFITSMTGLIAPWWKRLVVARALALEVVATADGISHHLLVPQHQSALVLGQLRAAIPSLRIDRADAYQVAAPAAAIELGLSALNRPLQTTTAGPTSEALLSSLQPLSAGESVAVQWLLAPVGPVVAVSSGFNRGRGGAVELVANLSLKLRAAEALQAQRAKQATPLFQCVARIGVVADGRQGQHQLLQRAAVAFHTVTAPSVHFFRRQLPKRWVARRLAARALPVTRFPLLLNAGELAAVIGWPIEATAVPGLELGRSRQLAPPAELPSSGRVVADSNYAALRRPLAMPWRAVPRHVYAIGPTGTGKTTLLINLALQDAAHGNGVWLVAPEREIGTQFLDRLRIEDERDVVVLDPTDSHPVGFNLLARTIRPPELIVDQIVGTFHELWRAFWGPRTQDILRSALLTLMADDDMTLAEVPRVLTDGGFRRRLVGSLDDPFLLSFWATYDGWSDAERAQAVGPVMNKLRTFLVDSRLRRVLGQSRPRFSFEDALARRSMVLVVLPPGELGEEATALLGALVLARFWQALSGRTALPTAQRPMVSLFIDELAHFLHGPTSVETILTEARRLNCGAVLAHQHLGQLPAPVRQAILANCASQINFRLSADDARVMARQFAPFLDAADLAGLGSYEIALRLATEDGVATPATGATRPLPPPLGTAATWLQRSRREYGRDATTIDAELRQRQEPTGTGPIGRRAR